MPALRPDLPAGQAVRLAGRGTTWVYDSGPPADPDCAGRPAVVLLHGWTSSAALNWFRTFPILRRSYRVVALDHRGHGRGIRSRRPFRLEDCADDVAALINHLGLGPSTVVGYSMGGPIAQLTWQRHPEVVDGLVLCATAGRFGTPEQLNGPFGVLGYGVALGLGTVPALVRQNGFRLLVRNRMAGSGAAPWAIAEWERNDPAALMQAGMAIGRFDATAWLPTIDVPTAVVVTEQDSLVSPHRQQNLLDTIPGALRFGVAADHRACVENAREFVPVLAQACRSVQRTTAAR
jgi:3-oxoadipate enol-lactonase